MILNWLYLDLNSYFASVEQQLQKQLRNKPIAIVPTMTDATCAIAASYEAKAYGIKTGTMIYKAKKLCPELICIEANHENYVTYHHKILTEINKYIPIEIISSIDEVACKLMGNQKQENPNVLFHHSQQKHETNVQLVSIAHFVYINDLYLRDHLLKISLFRVSLILLLIHATNVHLLHLHWYSC